MKKLVFGFIIVLFSIAGCSTGPEQRDDAAYMKYWNSMKEGKGREQFSVLRGAFSKRELKQISRALDDNGYIDENELSSRLRNKLWMTGNEDMFR